MTRPSRLTTSCDTNVAPVAARRPRLRHIPLLGVLLRGLGLGRPRSTFDPVDIHPGIESTRLRLFVLTGNYWRGT